LVLVGVFFKTFAKQVVDGVMFASVFIVLVVWLLWYLLVSRPRDPRVIARRQAREAARTILLARAVPSAPPAPPHGGPPDKGAAGEKKEGGEQDA